MFMPNGKHEFVPYDKVSPLLCHLHRGYYTVVRRYEFYFRVAKQYITNEHSILPRENKIHVFKPLAII